MTITYRSATIADSRAIAEVQVNTWRTAFINILPDDVLIDLSADDRESAWRERLVDKPENKTKVTVASTESKVVGFSAYGPARKEFADCDAEIYTLFILSDYQGMGIGRQLVTYAAAEFVERAYSSMVIWVFKENAPARAFYQALGGSALLEKTLEVAGQTYPEVGYVYTRLTEFTKQR